MLSQVSFAFCALSASNVPGPIFNRQSIACPASSCRGRCGPTGPEDPWSCYWDPLCRILRDCCPDAGYHCFSSEDSHIQIQTLVMDALKNFMECRILDGYYSINHDFSGHKLVQMSKLVVVTSCPVGTGKDLADSCQSKFGSPLHALPARHPQHEVVFFNTYCALCHGCALVELTTFEADVSCSPENLDVDVDITDVGNFWEKCSPFVQVCLPPKCLPSMKRQQCFVIHGRRWWGCTLFGLQESCHSWWCRTNIPQPILHPICWHCSALTMFSDKFWNRQHDIQSDDSLPIQYPAWHQGTTPCYPCKEAVVDGWFRRCFACGQRWANKK